MANKPDHLLTESRTCSLTAQSWTRVEHIARELGLHRGQVVDALIRAPMTVSEATRLVGLVLDEDTRLLARFDDA